jgi:hypothetical protein
MQIPWKRAAIAGIAGTILFDVTGLTATAMMGDPVWWDIPALLADKLGLPLLAGLIMHYTIGVVLAVLYAAIAPSLWGSSWARALTFVTVQTVLGVWLFMAPLLGMGIAGIEAMGLMFAALSLLRHWAFGAALATVIPLPDSAHAPSEVHAPRMSSLNA